MRVLGCVVHVLKWSSEYTQVGGCMYSKGWMHAPLWDLQPHPLLVPVHPAGGCTKSGVCTYYNERCTFGGCMYSSGGGGGGGGASKRGCLRWCCIGGSERERWLATQNRSPSRDLGRYGISLRQQTDLHHAQSNEPSPMPPQPLPPPALRPTPLPLPDPLGEVQGSHCHKT